MCTKDDEKKFAAVTIINEGSEPIAVFPAGYDTRIELHKGERATVDGACIAIEPALLIARQVEKE